MEVPQPAAQLDLRSGAGRGRRAVLPAPGWSSGVSRDVHLDFRREQRPPLWPGVLLLLVALASAGALALQYQRVSEEVASVEASVRATSAGVRVKPAPRQHPADMQAVGLELKRATEIAAQLRLPWTGLFRSIE